MSSDTDYNTEIDNRPYFGKSESIDHPFIAALAELCVSTGTPREMFGGIDLRHVFTLLNKPILQWRDQAFKPANPGKKPDIDTCEMLARNVLYLLRQHSDNDIYCGDREWNVLVPFICTRICIPGEVLLPAVFAAAIEEADPKLAQELYLGDFLTLDEDVDQDDEHA